MKAILPLLLLSLLLLSACDDDDSSSATCEGITCSSAGTCQILQSTAVCICDTGYTGVDCEDCSNGYIRNANDLCVLPSECTEDLCSYHGSCDDAGGTPVCTCDLGYQGTFCDGCAPDYVEDGQGGCILDQDPQTCHDYRFGASTFIQEFLFEGQQDCCFDYTSDGVPDNNFLNLCLLFEMATDSDCNTMVADAVADGEILKLLEFHGLTALADGALTTPFFNGTASGQTYTVAEDQFVQEEGLCTAAPNELLTGSIDGTTLQAHGDALHLLDLPVHFPQGTFYVPLSLHDVRLEADLSDDVEGVTVVDGRLGGWTYLSLIFDTLNALFDEQCSCLGLTGPRIAYSIDAGGWDIQCDTPAESTCTEEDNPMCASSFCNSVLILQNLADVDTDDDGVEDAVSVGVRFSGGPAEISGITP